MTKVYSFRSKFVDPDFRRQPKTGFFCFVCQKDIAPESLRYMGHAAFGCVEVVHPEDRAIANRELGADDNMGLLPAGRDCARRIGLEWFVQAERREAE